jgi:predicted RND superfamily exporter protein
MRVSFQFNGYQNMERKEAMETQKEMENNIVEFNKQAGEGINKGFNTAYDNWSWHELRGEVVSSALQGIVFSCLFAFIILVLTTKNWFISLIAIASISSIILQLFGVMKLLGWDFGIIESTCVIVFIGVSVDYVVHFSHQYVHSIHQTREEKTDAAFKQMGSTILAGGLTSCFSGIFLIIC